MFFCRPFLNIDDIYDIFHLGGMSSRFPVLLNITSTNNVNMFPPYFGNSIFTLPSPGALLFSPLLRPYLHRLIFLLWLRCHSIFLHVFLFLYSLVEMRSSEFSIELVSYSIFLYPLMFLICFLASADLQYGIVLSISLHSVS